MLDVHPPHKRLREVGEYFIHLVIITIGLLIATQIESCEEWRAHRQIAAEAREALHKEIASNLKQLRDAQVGLKQWKAQVDDGLRDMQRIIDHPNDPAAQPHRLGIGCSSITLDDTAWKTAQSTGALDYMPYDEAASYVNIYQAQDELVSAEGTPCTDAAAIYGIITKSHLDAKGARVTLDEAEAMAEKFGIMEFHLGYGGTILDVNVELNTAFIEGRKPKSNFNGGVQ